MLTVLAACARADMKSERKFVSHYIAQTWQAYVHAEKSAPAQSLQIEPYFWAMAWQSITDKAQLWRVDQYTAKHARLFGLRRCIPVALMQDMRNFCTAYAINGPMKEWIEKLYRYDGCDMCRLLNVENFRQLCSHRRSALDCSVRFCQLLLMFMDSMYIGDCDLIAPCCRIQPLVNSASVYEHQLASMKSVKTGDLVEIHSLVGEYSAFNGKFGFVSMLDYEQGVAGYENRIWLDPYWEEEDADEFPEYVNSRNVRLEEHAAFFFDFNHFGHLVQFEAAMLCYMTMSLNFKVPNEEIETEEHMHRDYEMQEYNEFLENEMNFVAQPVHPLIATILQGDDENPLQISQDDLRIGETWESESNYFSDQEKALWSFRDFTNNLVVEGLRDSNEILHNLETIFIETQYTNSAYGLQNQTPLEIVCGWLSNKDTEINITETLFEMPRGYEESFLNLLLPSMETLQSLLYVHICSYGHPGYSWPGMWLKANCNIPLQDRFPRRDFYEQTLIPNTWLMFDSNAIAQAISHALLIYVFLAKTEVHSTGVGRQSLEEYILMVLDAGMAEQHLECMKFGEKFLMQTLSKDNFDDSVECMNFYYQVHMPDRYASFGLGVTLLKEWKWHVERENACQVLQSHIKRRLRGRCWHLTFTDINDAQLLRLDMDALWLEDEWLIQKARSSVMVYLKEINGNLGQKMRKESGMTLTVMDEALYLDEKELRAVLTSCDCSTDVLPRHKMIKVPITAGMLAEARGDDVDMLGESAALDRIEFYCLCVSHRAGTLRKDRPIMLNVQRVIPGHCFHELYR